MTKREKIKLSVDKLLVGLVVDLELSWTQHPFLFSKFKIKDKAEIAVIKKLGVKEVTVFPEQSDLKLAQEFKSEPAGILNEGVKQFTCEKWKEKNEKIASADKYRRKRSSIAKKYKEQAAKVRKLTHDLKTQPANAIHSAVVLIDNMVKGFESENDVLTNLVNLGSGYHTQYNHNINVTVLSMSLAAIQGIKGDQLRLLARGALLHDVGKVELPGIVRNKKTALNNAEMGVFRQHSQVGQRLCALVEDTPEEVLQIIELHHEFLDGSGFPHQYKGEKIPEMARIVGIANLYDNLCNPSDITKVLTPKIAMATMYSKYRDKIDNDLVQRFISRLGVYPPGSVVKLNDESLGLVISVDPKDTLNPEVLLYNPDIPPMQALIINLQEYSDLKIKDVLKSGEYPKRVHEYLGIEERLGYMTSQRE